MNRAGVVAESYVRNGASLLTKVSSTVVVSSMALGNGGAPVVGESAVSSIGTLLGYDGTPYNMVGFLPIGAISL